MAMGSTSMALMRTCTDKCSPGKMERIPAILRRQEPRPGIFPEGPEAWAFMIGSKCRGLVSRMKRAAMDEDAASGVRSAVEDDLFLFKPEVYWIRPPRNI